MAVAVTHARASGRTKATRPANFVFLVVRTIFMSLFLLASINKIADYDVVAAQMEAAGLSSSLLPAVIALEGIGGLIVALGPRLTNRQICAAAALSLAVFTLGTNVVFHRFWELEGALAQLELSLFFKNVSIAGGLLLFVAIPFLMPPEMPD